MLDANGTSLGLPWVTITELETTNDVNAYGVPEDVGKTIIGKYPSMALGAIPKGTYKNNPDKEIPTLTMWNFMAVHKDAPADFVYEVVKKTFENVDILVAAHPSAKEVKPGAISTAPSRCIPALCSTIRKKALRFPTSCCPNELIGAA